jgi:hypothetical protein
LNNGTIELTISNGTPAYSYSYDAGKTFTAFSGSPYVIEFLSSGIYDLLIQDETGCEVAIYNAEVGQGLSSSIVVGTIQILTQPTCADASGSIRLIVSGGSGNYEYRMNGQGTYQDLTSDTIKNLPSGSYKAYVRDKLTPGCDDAISEEVILNPVNTDLDIIVTPHEATACGVSDGSLTISVRDGVAPFNYLLNGNTVVPVNNQILNQKPGIYVVDVIDDEGCKVSSGSVEIKAENGLDTTVSNFIHTTCGNSTGSFTITVNGNAPYTYQIDGGMLRTTNSNVITAYNLAAGNHVWYVIDADSCYANGRATIENSDNEFSFAVTTTDVLCDGVSGGSIAIYVTGGAAPYKYSFDNGSTWTSFTANDTLIENVLQGSYDIIVLDADNCSYEYQNADIKFNKDINPPTATTPQTFCSGATVADLYAIGANIKWYDGLGNELSSSTALVDGTVYYAAQVADMCESRTRTAVKVIIDDNVILDVPRITSPQTFCAPATLADIMIGINTNPNSIKWYDAALNGNQLPLTTPLTDGTSYYAALSAGGTCETTLRTEVEINIVAEISDSVAVVSPQYFCASATIANISVPHNQVLWYDVATGGTPLDPATLLSEGYYYVTRKAGACESTERIQVEIIIGTPKKPVAQEKQVFCDGAGTLADIAITGYGIVWYATETDTEPLPTSTPLAEGATYYAAQSTTNCEGERLAITVSFNCFTVAGTVFPFVHEEGDDAFNSLFLVTVKLFAVPALDNGDPIDQLLWYNTPLHITRAIYYDGTEFIQGTPKHPGTLNAFNNPGVPIDWSQVDKTPGTIDNTILTGVGDMPTSKIGLYKFEAVGEGEYILEISRQGYLTRWAKVIITEDGVLGHREILPGDVNGSLDIDAHDLSTTNNKMSSYGGTKYDPKYDFNADGSVFFEDRSTVRNNFNVSIYLYQDVLDWLMSY